MAKNSKPKRPSRGEVLMITTAQDIGTLSTADILRRRDLVVCEMEALEAEIHELMTRVAAARPKRDKLEAILAGITLAVNRRQVTFQED